MITFIATSELARVGRFGAVGILNTILDFGVFNLLSSKRVGWTKLQANTASTTLAMIFSFVLNRTTVFGAHGSVLAEAVSFFVVTATGLYVLQNGIIYILAQRWAWPKQLTRRICLMAKLPDSAVEILLKNGAKAVGTVASLTWNYILYKRVVFRV